MKSRKISTVNDTILLIFYAIVRFCRMLMEKLQIPCSQPGLIYRFRPNQAKNAQNLQNHFVQHFALTNSALHDKIDLYA